MNINFRMLLERIRAALGITPNRHTPFHSFHPEVEMLEDLVVPSADSPHAMAVYHAHHRRRRANRDGRRRGGPGALANSQTINQAIGPALLQTVTNQIETDLAPLSSIDFGGTPAGGLFGAASDADFGQKAADFIKNCVNLKIFARCATQASADGAAISGYICPPAQLAGLSGAVVYGTACVEHLRPNLCLPNLAFGTRTLRRRL